MSKNMWVVVVALGLAACASSKANGGAATEPVVSPRKWTCTVRTKGAAQPRTKAQMRKGYTAA